MPTDGTDVKVYTVGLDYAHAEARKSPALDGKVERDSEGKEVRYPVILSNAEKLIARRVCQSFNQMVCGFDLLRADGKSYVCDVNGFSFVKNSSKYYDDCAQILGHMVLRELSPQMHIPYTAPYQLEDPPFAPTTFGKMMELRCVCAVIRHGDRTPKQKMKMEVRHQKFFDIFAKYGGWQQGHVKLKHPKQLQEILDTARELLADPNWRNPKMEQLRSVLEMYGHFSGINRKVQMKYKSRDMTPPPSLDSSDTEWDSGFSTWQVGANADGGSLPSSVTTAPAFPPSFSRRPSEDSYLVLILKWGGELTPAGRVQAEELGRVFRCMYPGGQGEHAGEGLGLLRLHSTYRHDLKIYASDEGRVQMTAAAFAKGLLALEGELTPILVQMKMLLQSRCMACSLSFRAKARLYEMLQVDRVLSREERARMNPTGDLSLSAALQIIGNPAETCRKIHGYIRLLITLATNKSLDPRTRDVTLYLGETWAWMLNRWSKLDKDFFTKEGKYDISKIPDIYDCVKYDLQHNQYTIQFPQTPELYTLAKAMADVVIPQEYGLTAQEKLTIGQGICAPLLRKLRADMQRNLMEENEEAESVNRLHPHYSRGVSSPSRHVRTRLYFTSESHIHSLVSILRYGCLVDESEDKQWNRAMEYVGAVSELSYLSQLVIMLYEDPTKEPESDERFHVEVHFSPGVNCCVGKELPPGPGFRPQACDSGSKSPPLNRRRDPDVIVEESSIGEDRNGKSDDEKEIDRVDSPNLSRSVGFNPDSSDTSSASAADRLPDSSEKEGWPSSEEVFLRPKVVRGSSDPTSNTPLHLHSPCVSMRTSRASGAHGQCKQTLDLMAQETACRIPRSSSVSESTRGTGPANSPQSRKHRHSFESTRSSPSFLKPTMSNRSLLGSSNTVSMFSTAVISGNIKLNDEEQDSAEDGPIAVRACGGVPGIRPLETLHNSLSLKQLDGFLERLTTPSRSSSMKGIYSPS
ncbi:unnamed protein product [Notodromas monacha]|nr:unnamed protein product [Notodromas monacha]CAG0918637.1 unnamed protein product [Notodromas monacha]